VLVGGTWVKRQPGKMWDTASAIIFIVIAAMVTVNLVYVQVRQADAFRKAKDRLNCVSTQIEAIRVDLQAPAGAPLTIPSCDVKWDDR
jgi:hypothetical protein